MLSHHAQKSHASGFCYVADIVLALMRIKRSQGRPRILYLDLDLHFSDGVSTPFSNSYNASNAQILTLSIHHAAPGFFPSHPLAKLTSVNTNDPFTLSVPLHAGASASTFANIWTSIEKIKEAFKPEYVVLQCGTDGLAGDPMAKWNWTIDKDEMGSMGWCVLQVLTWNCRTLLLGGGKLARDKSAP